MKVVELLQISSEMLKTLHRNGISIDDYKHLPLLLDFMDLKGCGYKTTYIVASLSQKYSVCERKVYKLLKLMLKDCQFHSVG